MSVSGFSTWHLFTAAKQLLSGSARYRFSYCPSLLPWALDLWFLLIHLPAPDMGTCRFCRMRLFPVSGSTHPPPASLKDCMTVRPPHLRFRHLLHFRTCSSPLPTLCFCALPSPCSLTYAFAFAIFPSCSVTKLCLILCNPMDCSTPSLPVPHHLLEFAQIHVTELVMPSNHLILFCPLLLLPPIFLSIRVFSNEGWEGHRN